jgi:hypothetical protein
MLILFVFKKYKKKFKNSKFTKKKRKIKLRDHFLRPSNILHINISKKKNFGRGGGFTKGRGASLERRKKKKETLNLSLL